MRSLAGSVIVGLVAGVSGWVFLESLEWATSTQGNHRWLLFGLPLVAAAVTHGYSAHGGRSIGGTSLAVNRARGRVDRLPFRMAPFVLAGTVVSHLFGASVGREGTAVQMSVGLIDQWLGRNPVPEKVRRRLLVAAVAGGFGAVFGVPWAAAVFAVEVTRRWSSVLWCVAAAWVGHATVGWLGHDHAERAAIHLGLGGWQLVRLAALGVVCGVVATMFVRLLSMTRAVAARWVPRPAVRGALGGAVVVLVGVSVGREYLGLSLPLADAALAGAAVGGTVWLWKVIVTVVSLGSGLPGGEVTPLFVIGSTVASAVAGPLGLVRPGAASLGFVAVFAGAAKAPLACTVMAGELFGWKAMPAALVCCVVARLAGPHRGLYPLSSVS